MLILSISLFAKERDYQVPFCKALDGEIEYVLEDRTRIDCLTDIYAIEIDYAKKHHEAVGQALYYGIVTGRKPAVALIVGINDKRFLNRLRIVSKKVGIKVFIITKQRR